jgi:Family of unknown function (DUF5677)
MEQLTTDSLPEIERVSIDSEALKTFTHEDDFTGLAVSLMMETASWVSVAACIMGDEQKWDRNRAAVGGNVVRLYKLLHAVLDQTCQRRQETSFIFCRLVFETLVNIRFMIQNFSPELIDSYIAYSFRHERKLVGVIQTNIKARDGGMLPIEDRMLKSINRSAAAAGINLSESNSDPKGPWGGKNLFEKSEAVGLHGAYLAAFAGTSRSVHGNWHEIYGSHLHWDEQSRFTPNLDWRRPRPQVLFAVSILVVDALGDYFEFMCGEEADDLFSRRLSDLRDRIRQVSDAHEKYLSTKNWPEI